MGHCWLLVMLGGSIRTAITGLLDSNGGGEGGGDGSILVLLIGRGGLWRGAVTGLLMGWI
ncbi:hypothetical protein Ancab_012011 [Ancistrocladus abbreviatus]